MGRAVHATRPTGFDMVQKDVQCDYGLLIAIGGTHITGRAPPLN